MFKLSTPRSLRSTSNDGLTRKIGVATSGGLLLISLMSVAGLAHPQVADEPVLPKVNAKAALPKAPEPAERNEDSDAPDTPKSKAERALSERGLERVGDVYLIKEEIDARGGIKSELEDLKKLEASLPALLAGRQQYASSIGTLSQQLQIAKTQSDNLSIGRNQLSTELTAILFRNQNQQQQTQAQRNSIQSQVFQLQNSMAFMSAQINTLGQQYLVGSNRLAAMQAEQAQIELNLQGANLNIEKKKEVFETRSTDLKKRYALLLEHSDVFDALKVINGGSQAWVTLGPEWRHTESIKELAAKLLEEAGFQLDVQTTSVRVNRVSTKQVSSRLTTSAEKEIAATLPKIVALEARLKKDPSRTSERSFLDLLTRVVSLVDSVEPSYQELKDSRLLRRAADVYQIDAVPLTPTPDFAAKAKRVRDIAAAHNITK